MASKALADAEEVFFSTKTKFRLDKHFPLLISLDEGINILDEYLKIDGLSVVGGDVWRKINNKISIYDTWGIVRNDSEPMVEYTQRSFIETKEYLLKIKCNGGDFAQDLFVDIVLKDALTGEPFRAAE